MKKAISVLLVLSMLLGTLALSATAAEGKSITLPFVYTTDDLGNDALKYTVAVTCNGDHIPEPEDPDPADGVTPEKAPCAEHTTVIFCKLGETSDDPDIDYTISYDMSVYGAPDENGEITGIDESFFVFLQQFDLLPLRRDQPVDFRHLPVEVAHNLVLLVAGRDGKILTCKNIKPEIRRALANPTV